jgi:NAD(P)-dependent dehydrogenase (short-subunit alcohol dehydrogenase family)
MGTYAVTGSASGMGQAVAQKLRANGHTVIGVDIKEADVVADLSTPAGRRAAAEGCWPPATAPSPGRYWPPVSARVSAPNGRA